MSGYKTFAVAGAGGLGKHIIEALLSKKKDGVISSVIVLSRSVSVRVSLDKGLFTLTFLPLVQWLRPPES